MCWDLSKCSLGTRWTWERIYGIWRDASAPSVLLVSDVVLPDRLLHRGLRDGVQAAADLGARHGRGSRSSLGQVTGEGGVVDLFHVFQHFRPSVFQQIGLALKTHTSRDKGSQSLITGYKYSRRKYSHIHAKTCSYHCCNLALTCN